MISHLYTRSKFAFCVCIKTMPVPSSPMHNFKVVADPRRGTGFGVRLSG